MEAKWRWAAAGGIALGMSYIIFDRLAERKREMVTVTKKFAVPAGEVIELIKQVELEPKLIPVISSVQVIERTDACVRYRVRAAGLPGSVKYRKWWDEELPAVHWESECGTGGFHHKGSIYFTELDSGSEAYLRSEHWVTAPVIGRLSGPMLTPVIQFNMEEWLERIEKELTNTSH